MELSISHGFVELNELTLFDVNAGSVWGVIGGIATVVAGVAGVVGGVALIGAPDPTMATKYAGGASIGIGVGAIAAGVSQIASNLK